MSTVALSVEASRTGRSARTTRRRGWRVGVPFLLVHLGCLGVLAVGWSPAALACCVAFYLVRMFGITAFYHRYFSHRAFQASRGVQLLGALLGATAAQRGPLWWSAHHRRHHRFADRQGDPHSPVVDTFSYSHLCWMFGWENQPTDTSLVSDLAAYPELRLLDRFHHVVSAAFAVFTFGLGSLLAAVAPAAHTSGPQLLVWGFCVSTVLLYHATFAVNSFGHVRGSRRFTLRDESRNNWWLALLTLGEGWHNNHHRYPAGATSGFGRFEVDATFRVLRCLARLGLVHDLRPVPEGVLALHPRPRRHR